MLPEKIVDDSSTWQAQHKWPQTYLLFKAEIVFNMMGEMYVALNMHTYSEKTTFQAKMVKT